MKLEWRARSEPLVAVAVAGPRELLSRRTDEQLLDLRGVIAGELVVLLGETDALPWMDGALYLGRDDAAPSLLLPTTMVPTAPLPLVERALLRKAQTSGPIAVLPERQLLIRLHEARPVSRPEV